MMEFLEFISQTPGHFIGFLIVLSILTSFVYKVLNSFFKNVFGNKKTKIKKVYVDEFGDEIEQ
jgi:F0F1-type ATP synthase membrane subunit b/b'